MHAFHTFMAFLRLDRHGGDGPRFQTAQRNRLPAFFAIAIGAVFNAFQRLINLVDQFARPVPGAEFQRPVRLDRGAVRKVSFRYAAFRKGRKRLTRFAQQILPPSEQFLPKIFKLEGIHKLLGIRGSVIGRQCHQHIFFFPRLAPVPRWFLTET